MAKYVFKRILISLATVFVLATLTFFLMKLLPGNPFLNDKVPKEIQQQQMEYYGLDKPVMEQYVTYMKNLLHGDFGTSLKYVGRSVTDIIKTHFPISAKLGLIAVLFAYAVGILFGVLCVKFKNRWPDYFLIVLAVAGISLPCMVIGPLLRFFLGVKLHLFPVSGWGTLSHIIVPAFVMSVATIASVTRSMRASMLNITTQDYIKTAYAKGLSPVKVTLRHELKNAMIPILTSMGMAIAGVVMGSFVVEQIFVIPGLGKHFVNAVSTLDYPLVMGLTVFYGSFLVLMNFIVDILYGIVDPRIRTS